MHHRICSFQTVSLRTLFFVLVAFVATLASCITLEDEVEEASPLSALKVDSAIVDDNFTMIYRAPKGATEIAPWQFIPLTFGHPYFLSMHSRTSNLCR